MQSDFNSAAPAPTRDQMGQELLAELSKRDTGDICDFARCLQLIAEGAALDVRTIGVDEYDGGETPLHMAVRHSQKDGAFTGIALALINRGADLEAKDNSGNTPLMCAAVYGNDAVAELLVDNGVKLDETNGSGYTALIWAGYWGKKDIATMLIRRGAKADIEDGQGHTAADWAHLNTSFSNPETAAAIKAALEEKDEFDDWRDKGMPAQRPVAVHRPLALKTRG